MTTWEIVPYRRFGPLEFDMTRDHVTQILGEPELARGRLAYYGWGTAGFDAADRCNWIATYPGEPVDAKVLGIPLSGAHDEVVARLAVSGYEARQGVEETGDAISTYVEELGVYLAREDADEQELSTVAAYRRHYWQQ